MGRLGGGRELRGSLLLFWCVYFGVLGFTNLLDLLHGLGALPHGWRYLAGNLPLIQRALGTVGIPGGLAGVLLLGVILWQWLAAWLFWQALRRHEWVLRAFTVAICLWAAFLVADEVFLTYALEAVHLRLFIAQLLSLLVVQRLEI